MTDITKQADTIKRLRELLAKFQPPWKSDESYTDSGGRYVGIESSAGCVFQDVSDEWGMDALAAELAIAAVNALPDLLAIAEAWEGAPVASVYVIGTGEGEDLITLEPRDRQDRDALLHIRQRVRIVPLDAARDRLPCADGEG